MNSLERVIATIEHSEPDRIPFDLGSTFVTGITKNACAALAASLADEPGRIELCDAIQQLAVVSESILMKLEVDVRGLVPNIVRKNPPVQVHGRRYSFTDEWGVTWNMPEGGRYFDLVSSPLSGNIAEKDVEEFPWPDPADPALFDGLEEKARRYHERGYAVILENLCAGIFEMCCRVRGAEQFYMDIAMNPGLACTLLDKFVDLKLCFYKAASERLGRYVQFVREVDDMAGQQSLLISPQMYRELIKPRHRQLFEAQKRLFPQPFYSFFHSDGAISEIIPDLIEIGVDVLNPVQLSAEGMEAGKLKKEYGRDLAFWGGGVDTQHILPSGTPAQVRQNVKERVGQLAPGGGFVFAAVHNIQDDAPAENITAMIEQFMQVRDY
ncbi:MAG: hypothetical protein JSU94_00785 [Phycisphaerales bacterium]|nr:MAG: hypothetical protein JSU94_00785 [Phycisphaerales bacterium]